MTGKANTNKLKRNNKKNGQSRRPVLMGDRILWLLRYPTVCMCVWQSISRVWLFVIPWPIHSLWNSLCKNTGVGSLSLLQGIFPTQGLNPGFPHCRWILYQLSHKGSPRILEWVSYPFSSRSSWPKNRTGVSCIAGRFFTNWAIRKPYCMQREFNKLCQVLIISFSQSQPSLFCTLPAPYFRTHYLMSEVIRIPYLLNELFHSPLQSHNPSFIVKTQAPTTAFWWTLLSPAKSVNDISVGDWKA